MKSVSPPINLATHLNKSSLKRMLIMSLQTNASQGHGHVNIYKLSCYQGKLNFGLSIVLFLPFFEIKNRFVIELVHKIMSVWQSPP